MIRKDGKVGRSEKFIEVGFFLSKYGRSGPPERLMTSSWKEAYRMFYESLGEGRGILSFEHSLKNSRDMFDSHFPETNREGWKDEHGNPRKLTGLNHRVFTRCNPLAEEVIWERIKPLFQNEVVNYNNVFEALEAIEISEKPEIVSRTEGGVKVKISSVVERNPSLRNEALRIHGYDCKVCGFNFHDTYGEWGRDWAEVHHIRPISDHKEETVLTNPQTDMIVLCANCHRMIHRKKDKVLTIEELKSKLNLERR